MSNSETSNPEYDNLPECVKQYYTLKQWLWLSSQQKADLLQENTEPDCYD